MARANAFWPTAVVGEADSVNSVSASACHIGGPKGVSPGQKALFHGTQTCLKLMDDFRIYLYQVCRYNVGPLLSISILSFGGY